jgi:hypothetical protein
LIKSLENGSKIEKSDENWRKMSQKVLKSAENERFLNEGKHQTF